MPKSLTLCFSIKTLWILRTSPYVYLCRRGLPPTSRLGCIVNSCTLASDLHFIFATLAWTVRRPSQCFKPKYHRAGSLFHRIFFFWFSGVTSARSGGSRLVEKNIRCFLRKSPCFNFFFFPFSSFLNRYRSQAYDGDDGPHCVCCPI